MDLVIGDRVITGEKATALITFLVTASGFSLGGIGSAFWGLIAGGIALLLRPRAH